jgi:hypothetical protein
MKHLSDYIEQAQTEAFSKAGAFFAFGDEQYKEKAKDGIKYVSMGMGLICPESTAKTLHQALDKIYIDGIKQDQTENTKEDIILRELKNHECFYTWEIDVVIEKLTDYNITEADILTVWNTEKVKDCYYN